MNLQDMTYLVIGGDIKAQSRGEETDPGDIVNSDIAVARESYLDDIFATHESS